MQFGYIEDPFWGYGPIARTAVLFIGLVLIALIYHFARMLIDFSRLRRQSERLGEILLTQFAAGKWNPTTSSWVEVKDPHLLAIVEALRQELSGQGPLAVIASLSQVMNLLGGRFMRMVRRMQVLGWSTCLAGWIGALDFMHDAFRGMTLVGSAKKGLDVASMIFAEAFKLQIYGLAVGLGCLAISSFSRNRLHVLLQNLSDRILAASQKK
jgi:hypothetical protein